MLRGRLVHRRHRRDRIAGVAHFVDRDDGLIFIGGAEHAQAPLVVARDHGENAGELLRRAGVDAGKARVGVGAAQNFPVGHIGQLYVHRVERFAGHFLRAVGARLRFADDSILR